MNIVNYENKLRNYNFEALFKKLGYAYFTKGMYNLNIIGIRTKGNSVTNCFDDYIVVIYKTPQGTWSRKIYSATTDPGLVLMKKPSNPKGTAILVPGQYRGAWVIAKHRGKYDALCQRKPVKVYRDNNKDEIYDFDVSSIDSGTFGINIHKAGMFSKRVDNWSAGCQVFRVDSDFKSFMVLCKKQRELYGNSFTYTLLKEEDLV